MIDIAVLGCGRWGPNHVRVLNQELADCRVRVAADPDKEKLAPLAERYPTLETTTDPDAVLHDEAIDAVVVATPTATHADIVRTALDQGKHVFCEKPLCRDSETAAELAQQAEDQGLALMVGHIFLFNRGLEKVHELLEDGELGDLHYVAAVRTNLGPIRTDANAAFDLATHDVAVFNWMLDDVPARVSANGGRFLQDDIEDVVFAQLTYPNGTIASVHASWLNPRKDRKMTFVGSEKMATWDDLELNTPVSIYDKGAGTQEAPSDAQEYGEFLRIAMWDEEVRMPRIDLDEPLKVQDREFLAAIEEGRTPRSGGFFSRDVVRVIEAINESMEQDGAPVHL